MQARTEIDVRDGPSTAYPIIDTLPADEPIPIVGRNEDRTWWLIDGPDVERGWVPNLLVTITTDEGVPVASAPPPPPSQPVAPTLVRGEDYIVQREDWLSKLSEKFYDDINAYWPIMAVTNEANAQNSTYARIDDEDFIEIGDKLRIPSTDDALAFMADFDPVDDRERLFPPGPNGQLLVGHWWTAVGEFAGLSALLNAYRADNDGVEVINFGTTAGAGLAFRANTLARLATNKPFDIIQIHPGPEVEIYGPADNLLPLNDIVEESDLLDNLSADLTGLIDVGGDYYVVPLSIHRGNVLWANTDVIGPAGVAVPTTLGEFFAACSSLQGQGITPLAMGTADGFELAYTFEVVLAGTVGPDKAQGLWRGIESWSDPEVTQALENFGRVLDCSNQDRATLNWVGGLTQLINDQAAFSLMGDWGYGLILSNEATDFIISSDAPGTQDQFLLAAEGFAVGAEAPNLENAQAFIETATTLETQTSVNAGKAGLCARTDCDYSAFPADRRTYLQNNAAALEDSTIIPMVTLGSGVTPTWQNQIIEIASQFEADRDVSAAQTALVDASLSATLPQ